MTALKPYCDIARLVWPLALGMVNNALMQFVDRAYLANESMSALEAIMPASSLAWVFLGFFQAIVCYSGVFVAQHHGANDRVRCLRSYHAGLWTALLSAVAVLALVPAGDWILAATAPSSALAAQEKTYYDIVLCGSCFLLVQMAITSYFTGCGRTRVVFWVNLLGNLLNIALDPIFIFGWWGLPHLGIAGAAYATVLAQAVQFVVLIALAPWFRAEGVRRMSPLTLDRPLREQIVRILRYGIPAGGYEILNMASFTAFVFVTGATDEVSFAASNACFAINYLMFAPTMGFALGAQTLVGQACGRGSADEAVRALRRTLLLGIGFVILVYVPVIVFSDAILTLFAPSDAGARTQFLAQGHTLLMLMSCWLLLDAADVIVSGALRGAGDTRFVFLLMLVCSLFVWLPLVLAAHLWHNTISALWTTMIAYTTVICFGSVLRWRGGRWKEISLV